jgi:cell division protein FtsL
MSYVETAARDALVAATADREGAGRALLVAAALLLLLHVLTVTPYVHTTAELTDLAPKIAHTKETLEQLQAQTQELSAAKEAAKSELKNALDNTTDNMKRSFRTLTDRISRRIGSPLDVLANNPVQSAARPPPNLPDEQTLTKLIAAVQQDEVGWGERLTQYARDNLVLPAYAEVNRAWKDRISSKYLAVIDKTGDLFSKAQKTIPDEASALKDAEVLLVTARQEIENIAISPDDVVDQALGSVWWKSEEGKGAQANAVAQAVDRQLSTTANLDKAVAAIANVLSKQGRVQAELTQQQVALEKQLEESRNDILAIAGSSAVVPFHAKTLISLFPLVLGTVLAFMIFRVAESRRAATEAAVDLADVSKDEETRLWLLRRALGDQSLASLEAIFIFSAATIWIVVAAVQIYGVSDVLRPPLPVWASALTGEAIIVVSSAWNHVNLRRLAALVHNDNAPLSA